MGADSPAGDERVRAALQLARTAQQTIADLEDRVDDLEDVVETQRQTIRSLDNEVSRLRQEFADTGGPRWRIGRFLSTLRRQAEADKHDAAALEVSDAHAAVNARVSETQIRKDFRKVEGLVEDGKLPPTVEHVQEDRHADQNTRLRLTGLDQPLPREFGGVEVVPEEGV